MRSSSMFWGAVLIIAGGLFLLSNLGIIAFNFWGVFWPLVIIALGVWTLFGFSFRKSGEAIKASQALEGASRAYLQLHHGAGRLRVSSGASPGEFLEGSFQGGVDIKADVVDEQLDVGVKSPARLAFPVVWLPGDALNWEVRLTQEIPISIDIKMGANEARLDLSDLLVSKLHIESGANSTELVLPARAGHTKASISCGAASFRVQVPEGVAARIRYTAGLASVTVDSKRFPRQGGEYRSSDYETAENRVDLMIETGVGSVTVG